MIQTRRMTHTDGRDTDRRQHRRHSRRQGGAALAEYGLLLAGLTLASMVAVSVLGGKVGGMIASVATVLPGTSIEDSATVQVGELIETEAQDMNGDGTLERVMSSSALHSNATEGSVGMARALGVSPSEAGHLAQIGDRQQHQQRSP